MQEIILNLFKLQNLDNQLMSIEKLREGLPQKIEKLNDKLTKIKEDYQNLFLQKEELEMKVKTYNDTILEAKSANEKYQEHKKQITNNKEYEALSQEIEFNDNEILEKENSIEQINQELQPLEEKMEALKAEQENLEQEINEKNTLLDQKIAETKQKQEELEAIKKEVVNNIPKKYLNDYRRVYNSKNYKAVVAGDQGFCEGCYTALPSQKVSALKRKDIIVQCDTCSRILTWELNESNVDL